MRLLSCMIITWFFAMPAQAGFPDPEPVPGQSVGADLMVNMVLEGAQVEPDIALRPDGSLIVVWRQGSGGIRGRLIDRSGTPLGADFNVSDEGIRPKVGVTDTGFVVIIDMTTYIAFVLLDANGNDIGGEGLNVTFPSNSINPDLARLADGSFVVVWTTSSSPHDNSDYSIRARALSSAGQPVGDEIGFDLRPSILIR